MQRFRPVFRICFALVLMLLTVFNGRAMAGCICSDGHFELLCRGQGGCARSTAARQTKCCWQAKAGATKSCCIGKTLPNDCPQYSGTGESGSCCHPLNLFPMVGNGEIAPQLDVLLLAFDFSVTPSPLPAKLEQSVCVNAVDSGPPRDRLQLLQRLLI